MRLHLGSFCVHNAAADRSVKRAGRGMVTLAACLAAIVATPTAHAQSTWLPTSGTVSWLTSGSWSNSTVPNATGAVAVFPTGGASASIVATTVTTGTIRTTNSSGNVVIGNTATADDILKLDVSSGTPTIDVATGGILYMYANVTGSQGFTKTGGGSLVFRYNPDNMTYTGTVTMSAGTIIANQDGSLGDTSNAILVTGNSTLQLQSGASAGVTLNAGRSTTINSGVTWTMANGIANASSVANQVIGGSGNLNVQTGTFTLNGNNTYAGNTTLTNIMRLTLGSGAKLSTAGLTVATGSSQTFGTTVDLGGNSQSVSSLTITTASNRYVTTFTNGSLNVTGGNFTINSGTNLVAAGSGTYSFNGLNSLAYNNTSGTFAVSVSATTAAQTNQTVMNLANSGNSGTNTITAAEVKIGNSAASTSNQSSVLGLGKVNTFNTGTLTVGFYQGSGTVAFQQGVTNGSLTLRGTAGGSTPLDTAFVGYFNSGNGQVNRGTLDLTNGSLDAIVNTFNVGFALTDNSNFSASVTMPAGTLTAGTLALGAGSARSTATFTQSGGSVTAGQLLFGGTNPTGTPAYTLTYNLNDGILRSGTIATNSGTFGTSSRRIAWTSGTIANYDASTNLLIDGTTTGGTNGLLTIDLGGTGSKVVAPDSGRTITFGPSALISNTGGLTVNGAGTVVINGSNSYSGGTTLSAGTLRAGNANAFGTAGVTVGSGATLDVNSLAVGNTITNNGGTVSNAANYAGTQTLNGVASFGNVGGTLVVANGGTATFAGVLAAATTINAGGKGILNDLGSISALGLTNNGTFTIDRTGSSSLATLFSGNGTIVKENTGIVSLTGSSAFAGSTQINAGTLAVAAGGSLGGGLSIASGAVLGGVGLVGGVSGGGLIAPGYSPGILTSNGSLNPTGGIDFAFELTGTMPTWSSVGGSLNDIYHIKNVTPFTAALGAGNLVSVYFDAGTLQEGQTFLGGIFIDQAQGSLDLATQVTSATFQFYVAGGSDVTYNGVGYSTLANYLLANPAITGITVGTATVASADFGDGTITNGQVMQFAVVPEPGTLAMLGCGVVTVGCVMLRRGRRGGR